MARASDATLRQQKQAAKQRAMGVYQFYVARGFSSSEAQQMQVDHFGGKVVGTNAPLSEQQSVLAAEQPADVEPG